MRFRAGITFALTLVALAVVLVGRSAPSAALEDARIVPQLELTDLRPVKVAFAPDNDTLLMVVNSHGRIDLFDISNPGRPAKTAEMYALARDAAFNPKGTARDKVHIVSGGNDGMVRLWTLDGEQAAEPFKGSPDGVTTIAFSPDGTRIVSGGFDGTVRAWTLDGKPAAEPFKGHDGSVLSVAFSPDSRHIVSGGRDGTVRLWTLDGNLAAEPFKGHVGAVSSVAFSPDGTRIASGGGDGTLRLWTLGGSPSAEPFKGHDGAVSSVAFSPDGTRIVSGGQDGTVRLWGFDGKLAGQPFKGHAGGVGPFGGVLSVAFSADGVRIASSGDDGTVRLWALDEKPAAEPFKGHASGVRGVAFSPDGTRLVSGGQDGTVRIWGLDGKPAAEPFKGHDGAVSSVAFAPDGRRIVSGGFDGTVRLWTVDGKPAAEPFKGHDGRVMSVAFSPDDTRIVSGGEDGTVRLWLLDGKPAAKPFEGHDAGVSSVAFFPDGARIVSGGDLLDDTVRLWTRDGKPVGQPLEGRCPVTGVAVSPDGSRIASSCFDGTVRLWGPDGKQVGDPVKGRAEWVWRVAFSPDGTRIVSGGFDGTVRMWSLDGKPAREPFKGHYGAVRSVAFSPDGTRIVSGSDDGTLGLWTFEGKPVAKPFKGHVRGVSSVAFSPDGTRIISGGGDGMVRLWTLDGKPAAEPFEGHKGAVYSVAFAPDGTRIVSGGKDDTVRQWTLDGKPAAKPFKTGATEVLSVAFAPDGMRIASGGRDGTVRLWTRDGKPAAEPFEGHDSVLSLAFSPDGTKLVSSGLAGTFRLWNLRTKTSLSLPSCDVQGFGFVGHRMLWIGCSDRIVVRGLTLEPRGEIFLHKQGLVALLYGEGVYLPNDRIQDPFREVSTGALVIWQRHAVPEVSAGRVRQVLLNEWTLPERLLESLKTTYAAARAGYEWLGWCNVPFWPALAWAIITVAVWIFAPHKLSTWAMPSVGSPPIPRWKWLVEVLALFGYLGTTRRALKAWLRKHWGALYEQNFAGRVPVKDREKYCNLGHEGDIAAFDADLSAGRGARCWISGVGGSGKSALAYRTLRVATEGKASSPLPILVDEDWNGALLDQVVRLLRVGNRVPTPKMVEVLGSQGDLCLLIDSLSERGMTGAVDRVADELATGHFISVVVTSRQPRPDSQVWQAFRPITALPLTADQIPDYVATYAPPERRAAVSQQIAPLVKASRSVSPLFVRFAIEQALAGQVTATSTLDLVLQYVEALRAGRLDLNADDMLRAASVTAMEAVRESLVPREIEQAYLRVEEVEHFARAELVEAGLAQRRLGCGSARRRLGAAAVAASVGRRCDFAPEPASAERLE